LGAKLILNLIAPIFQSGAYLFAGAWIPARNYFREEIQERYRRGTSWARWASHQGINCEFFLDELSGEISKKIVNLTEKENIDLIALASRSGPVSSALLGSITRQVIRTIPCPVWIIHPEAQISSQKTRALAG
jgi:nucleotide-binding universal stress UspA family protein